MKLVKQWTKIKAALLWCTYVLTKEANPHGCARAADMHSEGGLEKGIGHTCQVHAIVPALF